MAISEAALGGIISAAGSVAGAGASAIATGNLNKKNRKWQEEQSAIQRQWSETMADKQNAWNYEMWLKEQDYNSPENQVQRLRDAGLNPLFYGLDGNSASQAQMAAQPLGYERASQYAVGNPVEALNAGAVTAAQVANIQAMTEKTKSETGAIQAKLPFEVDELKNQVRNSKLSGDAQETINKYLDRQKEAELRVQNSTVAEADAMVQKLGAEIQKMDYDKVSMFVSWCETNEKILNLQKQRQLTDKQMEELSSLIRVNNANADKIGLDVNNYDDVTVIGTASHNIHLGPFSVQEGQPITLAMMKAAQQRKEELSDKKNGRKSPSGQSSATDGSSYTGPIYD